MSSVRSGAGHRHRAVILPVLVAAVLGLAGCGSSVADRDGPRTVTTTQARAVSPFCEAVQTRRQAARPLSEPGRRVDDIGAIAERVRTANQQVSALAPQELRADFERVNGLIERQLRLLETNGGDTFALARDPDVARESNDPAYSEASDRINEYVRATC